MTGLTTVACLLVFTFPCVLCEECWISRTGQREWCNGYCCDTLVNGWGCCCDDGDDVQMIVLGLTAILLWTLGLVLYVVKIIMCYFGRDIYSEIQRKVKRRLAKWRRIKNEQYSRQLSEEKQLRRLFKENFAGTNGEEWKRMARLYGVDEESDDETGHELSCLCCDRYRITFGKV
ncbi:uncharacterized protein [Argopecten irradians]|uniref:uncharacterized protein n=1 Tax=Argopecten irradians TaxID=31199 RepID=UPI0037194713